LNKLQKLSRTLQRNGFETEIFQCGKLAAEKVCEMIKDHTVGIGNSMTIETLGLNESIKNYAKQVFPRDLNGSGENERNALFADFYLTSANAISMDGHIVNIDGTGNRVSATCFGPPRTIYLIGKNKITETLDDAMDRAKATAVKLAKHYNRKTPCVKTGKCENCYSPECVCSITTIHRKKPYGINISVFLIDEALGL
jgi:hypothetical protein